MGERLSAILPFVIAVLLPPAGVLLGLVEAQRDRAAGLRLIAVSVLAAIVWALLFVV
jgi:hypothetical protein